MNRPPPWYGLVGVTITGADDRVAVSDLVALNAEFPFVEWGLLYSTKRVGTPRYPSLDWFSRLKFSAGKTSVHLCGQVSRNVCAGVTTCVGVAKLIDWMPDRFQLNGYRHDQFALGSMAAVMSGCSFEVIFQVRDAADIRGAAEDVGSLVEHGCSSILFDASGGRGISPERGWPTMPDGVRMGYAGGIGPDNLDGVLEEIAEANEPVSPGDTYDYWIDMESGVRDGDDQLDLARVRRVLECAAPYVAGRPGL